MADSHGANGNGNGGDLVKLAGKYVGQNLLVIIRNLAIALFALWVWNNKFLEFNLSRRQMQETIEANIQRVAQRLDTHLDEAKPMMVEYLENKGRQDILNEQVAKDIQEIKADLRQMKEFVLSEPRRNWYPRNQGGSGP